MTPITLTLTPAEAALVSTAIIHNLRVCGPTGRDGALLRGVLDRLCAAMHPPVVVEDKAFDATHKGSGL